MLHSFFLVIAMTFVHDATSTPPDCSPWTTDGSTCLFAGKDANSYTRKCSNECWVQERRRNWGPHCNMETACFFKNPDSFSAICSAWTPESGVTCENPETHDWEQMWERVCKNGLEMKYCNRTNPNP